MDEVRGKLPGNYLAALSALIRILGSTEMSRGLFAERPPPARLKRLKKARPRKRKSSRG